VRTVALQELRHKEEAPVVTRQRTAKGTPEIKETPARREPVSENKTSAPHEPGIAPKLDIVPVEPAARATKRDEAPAAKRNSATPEPKPDAATKEPAERNANRQPRREERPAQQENKAKQPAGDKPAAHENNGANQSEKETKPWFNQNERKWECVVDVFARVYGHGQPIDLTSPN